MRALANNQGSKAVEVFTQAQRVYEEKSLPIPSSVSCGLSRALVAQADRGAGGAELREKIAHALTACLGATPPGTPTHDYAVSSLASLTDRGLDLAALDQPNGTLITGRDPRPDVDNTRVTLTFSGAATTEGARGIVRQIVADSALNHEVARCFLQWWEPSRATSYEGTIRVAYSRSTDEYDVLGPARVAVTAADLAPESTDAGTQHWLTCSAQAVSTAMGGVRWPSRGERWAEAISVTVATN